MEEKVKISEGLSIYVKWPDGRITEIKVKKLPEEKSLWDRIVSFFKHDGTLTDLGKEQLAKLWGMITPAYGVNQIGARYSTTWLWKTAEISYESLGKLNVSNSLNPWTGGYNFNAVGTRHTNLSDPLSTIPCTFDLSSVPSAEWWAKITFVFG